MTPINNLYNQPRMCVCGYVTSFSGSWRAHKKCCTSIQQVKETNDHWRSYDKTLRCTEQLSAKDDLKAMAEQLRAKDEQILNLTNQLQQANERLNAGTI